MIQVNPIAKYPSTLSTMPKVWPEISRFSLDHLSYQTRTSPSDQWLKILLEVEVGHYFLGKVRYILVLRLQTSLTIPQKLE